MRAILDARLRSRLRSRPRMEKDSMNTTAMYELALEWLTIHLGA
jgi:hypothetical protein